MSNKTFSVTYDSGNYEIRSSFVKRLNELVEGAGYVFGYGHIAELYDEYGISNVKALEFDFMPIADCFVCTSVYFSLGDRHFIGYIGSHYETVELFEGGYVDGE